LIATHSWIKAVNFSRLLKLGWPTSETDTGALGRWRSVFTGLMEINQVLNMLVFISRMKRWEG